MFGIRIQINSIHPHTHNYINPHTYILTYTQIGQIALTHAHIQTHLLNAIHDHLPVLLILILQVLHNT